MRKRTKIALSILLLLILGGGATLYILARRYAGQVEPYIREQAVNYLQQRFDADVALRSLEISLPALSPYKLYTTKGVGVVAGVTARGILLRKRGRTDIPPLLVMETVRFDIDLGQLGLPHKGVTSVFLDGLEITVPPKGQRPKFGQAQPGDSKNPPSQVTIGEVFITNAKLTILPKDTTRKPLEFDLHRIHLQHAGQNTAMKYVADLRNPKPPGEIHAAGRFGPWDRDEPGDTPLSGDYRFEHADLAVFKAIGGMLDSTGSFEGQLSRVAAKGEANVKDFYLKSVGNRIPLHTRFEAEVDGTNGNTILKPVHGRLGGTNFVTSGGIIKHEGDSRRTIELDVNMPAARLEDVLRLSMKGDVPFMSGKLNLKSRLAVPPLSGKVIEKLRMTGTFEIQEGKFLRSQIQDRIDQMSRQAQGQPRNMEIDEVLYGMTGSFSLADEAIDFTDLAFSIPGADLRLDGGYDIGSEELNFHGDLRLQAKLSQTQTGWKRWVLKPVDPFFSKNGAGLYTKIQITGTRKDPKFARAK